MNSEKYINMILRDISTAYIRAYARFLCASENPAIKALTIENAQENAHLDILFSRVHAHACARAYVYINFFLVARVYLCVFYRKYLKTIGL